MGALRGWIPAFEIIAVRRGMWSYVIGQRVFFISSRRADRVSAERYSVVSLDGGTVVNNNTELALTTILIISQGLNAIGYHPSVRRLFTPMTL